MFPSVNKTSYRESNPITQLVYRYLPESALLANLTPPNKQSFEIKTEFKSRDHLPNSINKIYSIWRSISCAFLWQADSFKY